MVILVAAQLRIIHGKLRAKNIRPLYYCSISLLVLVSLLAKCQHLDGEKG